MPDRLANVGYFLSKNQPKQDADNACVLVVHYNFEKTKEKIWIRRGDGQDVENLKQTFGENRNCKFHSILSPEKGELLQLLADQEKLLGLFGCSDVPSVFVLYILSHGDRDGIIFTDHFKDDVRVEDLASSRDPKKFFVSFTTTEIFESLNKLTGLEECLKLINFGPCRGELADKIFDPNEKYIEYNNENSCRITYIPWMKNTVVFFSTVETTLANRHPSGTPFVHHSCKVFNSLEKDESLVNVLTTIQYEIHASFTGQTPEFKMSSQDRSFVFSKSFTDSSASKFDANSNKIIKKRGFYSWKSSSGEHLRHRLAFLFSAEPNKQLEEDDFRDRIKEIRTSLSENLNFETSEMKLSGTPWTSINKASWRDLDIGCIFLIFFGLVTKNENTNEVCVQVDGQETAVSEILCKFIGPKNNQWIGEPKVLFLVNQETSSLDGMASKRARMDIPATNHSGWLVLVLHNKATLQKLIEIFKGQDLKREKSLQELLASLLISESKENRDFLNSTLQYLLNFPDPFVKPTFSVTSSNKYREKYIISFDRLIKESARENKIFIMSSVAGTGKTTILREMAFQHGKLKPESQILLVSLPEVSFSSLKRNVNETEFLAKATHNPPEKIAKSIENKQCVVLLDGFDEIIRPENQETTLKVIQALEKKQTSVWIGTRPNAAEAIQERINKAVLVQIDPLDEEQQIELLQLETGKSREESELFIKNFASKDILENPLHLSLVAKYGAEGNLYQIYDRVVRRKVEDSLIRKVVDRNSDIKFREIFAQAIKDLQKLASDHIRGVELTDYTKDDLQKNNCYGIATFLNNKVIFIHQTFAEFLAAKHFLNEIENSGDCDIQSSTEELFFGVGFSWCRKFIDLFYSNKEKIEEHRKSIIRVMKLDPDMFVQLISSDGCINIFKIIYPIVTFNKKQEAKLIYVRKDKTLLVRAIGGSQEIAIMLLDADLINSDEELLIILPFLLRSVAKSNATLFFEKLRKKYPKLPDMIGSRRFLIDAGVIAARENCSEILDLLLESGVDEDFVHPDEGNALHCAINHYRDGKCVEVLFKHGAKFADCGISEEFYEPLGVAVYQENVDLVKFLLEDDINGLPRYIEIYGGIDGDDTFSHALKYYVCDGERNFEYMKCLLKEVTSLNYAGHGYENGLLQLFAEENIFEMCEWLVDVARLDVNTLQPSGVPRDWSLKDKLCMDHFLMLQKSDINMADERGKTALHCAAERGYFEHVRKLINSKANVRAVDEDGWNAFHFACESYSDQRVNVIRLLLNNDRELGKVKTKSGQTGLHILKSYFYCSVDVARFLVEEIGIDVRAKNEDGWNAFHLACKSYSRHTKEVIRFLHSTDSQLAKEKSNSGQTGLHILMESSKYCSDDEARFLVEEIGVDVSAKDNNGCTALRIAVDKKKACVNYLMEIDIDLAVTFWGRTCLHFAAENDDLEALQTWIELGGNLDVADEDGSTALHYAARKGHLQFAKKILDFTAEEVQNQDIGEGCVGSKLKERLNRCDKKGRTALHLAAESGNVDLVKLLLEKNADLTLTDLEGKNAIHYAVKDEEMLRLINEKNRHLVKQCSENGNTALQLALKFDSAIDHNIIWWIVNKVGNNCLNAKNASGETPLLLACKRRLWSVAEFLLDRNVEVNISDREGKTAMHYAARKGKLDLVKLLHEKDANFALTDSEGMNALHHAIKNFEVFSFLHEKNKDLVNQRLKNGDSLFHLAIKSCFQAKKILRLVEQCENDLNVTNSEGETPLVLACKERKWIFAKIMLDKCVDINVKDKKGRTALHYAVQLDEDDKFEDLYAFDLVQELCKRGADLTLTDNDGMNAFHHAIGNCKMAVFIHESKCDLVKEHWNNGDTSLHQAIKIGKHKRNVNFLIWLFKKFKNYLNVTNSEGETPLLLACKNGMWFFAKILLEKTVDIDRKDKNGITALHYAIKWDEDDELEYELEDSDDANDLVQELCKRGADLTFTDNDGMNAFHHAIKNFNMALIIHEFNGDLIKQRLNNGDTTLHLAIKLNRDDNILPWLVEQCENDLNVTNSEGETPLMLACMNRRWNVSKILLDKRVDIHVKDKNGRTALHYAVNSYHAFDLVQELCKRGADFAFTDNDGMNAFHHAIGSFQMALFIHNLNGDLFKQRLNNGDTSLHLAIENYKYTGNVDVLIWLVEQVSDVELNARNSLNETPLILACKNKLWKNKYFEILLSKNVDVNILDNEGKSARDYIDQSCPSHILKRFDQMEISQIKSLFCPDF